MRARDWLLCAGILGCWLACSASAQQAIHWQPTLETAKRVASQRNRMVLVHVWADWCKSCAQMEREVFSRPDVAAALETDYVPVKLNADHFPAQAREYGVSIVPTDIILSPQGQLLEKIPGMVDASQYVARLQQIAAHQRDQAARAYAQMASGSPYDRWETEMPNRAVAGYGIRGYPPARPAGPARAESGPRGYYEDPNYQTANQPEYSGDGCGDYFRRQPQSEISPAGVRYEGQRSADRSGPRSVTEGSQPPSSDYAAERPDPAASQYSLPESGQSDPWPPAYQGSASAYQDSASCRPPQRPQAEAQPGVSPEIPAVARPSSTIGLPPGSPPLGLDGYCSVQLSEQERWVAGDLRWGARHRGRTYLFAGPEEQRRFLADPDRYAPVLSGNDVVVAVEQGQMVPGRREHGAWYQGHVYLFAGEASFEKFSVNPHRYAASLEQISSNLARRQSPPPSASRSGQTLGPSYGGRY